MHEIEKRKYFRYDFTEYDHFKAIINHQFEGKPLNISENGLSVNIFENKLIDEIQNEDILQLELHDLTNHLTLLTNVSVKWIIFDSIGVEFLNLNKKNKEIIDRIINNLIN